MEQESITETTSLPPKKGNKGADDQELLALTVGKNITRLRRMSGMTQLELAEKLNYSDKSISKWEQGNGMPDVRILVQLSALFNVTVDDLLREHRQGKITPKRARSIMHFVVASCSVGLCWLVAVVCFVFIGIFAPAVSNKWLAFLYAVPVSAIVMVVFSTVWRWKWGRIVSLSVLIWTVLACAFLTAYVCGYNIWLIFLIGVPLQILVLFYFIWRKKHIKD